MPKELNLAAYDYRNRRLSSRSSSNDSLYDEGEAALRGSCGTATTMGNDTVMTGDHVTAILRMQSASERQIQRLARGQPITSTTGAAVVVADSDSDEQSSSDSEGVVPKVCRRGSRANSVGSADMIAQDVGGHDNNNSDADGTPLLLELGNTLHTTNKSGGKEGEQYGTAMGGDEQQHPISNLLRDRQSNNSSNSNSNSNGNQNNSNGSEDSNNSNVYHIPDNTSALSSLASASTKSAENNRSSFISAVFNYSHANENISEEQDEEEQQQQRLVKVYSQQLEQKERGQGGGDGSNQEGEFQNDEENQQNFPNVHHRLLDVPHYHNIRSSFSSLVGQIKERVVDSSDNKKDPNEGEEDQYDLRLYDKPSSSTTTNNNSSSSPSSNKKRAPRRPIQRRTTTESESESMWNRRMSTESESMWTMLSSSLTRRASNESESTNTSANTYSTSHTANNSNTNAAGKESQLKMALSTLHDDDEEDKEPYDDSDIRSVASKGDTSWIGMGNLGNIIGSNIVNGSDGGGRMRKRGGGDGRGDYQHGSSNGTFGNSSSRNKRRFRLNPFVRRTSMTPFIGDDGGDYFDDDLSAKSYSYRPGITTLRRCGAIMILIVITILCSVLIGIYIPASVVGEDEVMIMGDKNGGEELFKIAESINKFCHVNKMHSAKGRAKCERICRNHLCCFDNLGDGYSCEGDKSKNCGVYAGCEVLVDSFDKEVMQYGGKDKNQAQQQGKHQIDDDAVILDGGFGDEHQHQYDDHYDDFIMYYGDDENGGAGTLGNHVIFYNPDGPSSTTDTQIQPQPSSEDAPSLSIDKLCTESAVSKVSGREKCETLCKDHHCCFDPAPKYSCRTDPDKMCSAYASCEVLTLEIDITDDIDENNDGAVTHEEIEVGLQLVGAACAESNINTFSGKQECEAICSSHICCFSKTDFNCRNDPEKSCPSFAPCEILNVMAAEKGKANGVVYYDDQEQVGENDSDPYNAVEAIQLNEEQKLHIQRDIESKCKSKSSPDCFHVCRDWFCCFDPSDEKSCRSSTNNLCNLVQECEVAALTSDILFSDEEEETSDGEDANQLPLEQMQQGQEDDYYQIDDFEEQSSQQQLAFEFEEDSLQLPSQKESSMKQDNIFPTQENNDFQSQSSSQQQSDLHQSSFSPQQQQVPDFDGSSSRPKPQMPQQIQDDQSDFRPPPPPQLQQQQQQQQQQEEEGNFQPQDGIAQPQQMQQDQIDFRPPPPPQFQQQQQQQQEEGVFQPQDVIVQPQQMQQDQIDFRPSPAQQQQEQDESNFQLQDSFFQPQQDQSDFRPPPPAQLQQQQQGNSNNQQQDGFLQPQQDPSMHQPLQQPIPEQQYNQAQPNMQDEFIEMQQEQNGQPFDHTAEKHQFAPQMQSQQPFEQFIIPPTVQNSPQQNQVTAQEQQSSTNLTTSKKPRPPPARCISNGDDDFHTETYNDDWNDDSYDRCKRWESKYGMKISQYFDMYGAQ